MEFTKSELINLISLVEQRRVGHTTLLQNGIKNYNRPFLFVCKTPDIGKFETGGNKYAIFITPENAKIAHNYRDMPIAFAHEVILDILLHMFSLYHKPL